MTAPHQRQARTGADLRLLRAAMFAAVCLVLSAGGHVLASCATVPLWTLGAGFLAVLVLALPLAGRERSLPGIAGALAVGQLGLHALFGLGQHGTAMAAGGTGGGSLVERAARIVCGAGGATITPVQARQILETAGLDPSGGHGAHAHATGEAAAQSAMVPGPALSLLPTLPMLLAHVLAAVAAGWLLRRGDVALMRLVRLSAQGAQGVAQGALMRSLRAALTLVRALRAGLPGAAEPASGPARAARALVPPKLRAAALQHTVIRRGPPAPAVFSLAA
ncbi:hypothetical protein [Streptomyces sp. MNP-20]|uniref:hypothetical protein n=1 Tax=Streptomyces sp. MNP-20 TaxID=2721165 RepID=UPI0015580B04|nr:hypothetical protein [Streptomyces sp. MNP-20]